MERENRKGDGDEERRKGREKVEGEGDEEVPMGKEKGEGEGLTFLPFPSSSPTFFPSKSCSLCSFSPIPNL